MNNLKILLKGSNILFQICFFVVSVSLILLISYFLGFSYLQGVKGNDSMYHLTNILWFDKFFPNIPYWYPLQNGGVVPIWGYPALPYIMVIILHKLSGLSIILSFEMLGFLSVPLTAIGLYLYVATRLKNTAVAIIAAVFYCLMPLTWVWLYDWGFYTENIAYIFFFPALLTFDIFISRYLTGSLDFIARLSFALTIVILGLAFLAHPTLFFVLMASVFALGLVKIVKYRQGNFWVSIAKAFLPALFVAISTVILLSFYIFNFNSYAGTTSQVTSAGQKAEFVNGYPTPIDSLLGLDKISPTEFKFVHRNIVVPPVVWAPGILGTVAAIFLAPEVVLFGFLAALPVIFFKWPEIPFYLPHILWLFGYITSHRAILLFIRFFAPIVGAFGVWVVFAAPLKLLTFWIKGEIAKSIKNFIIAVIAGTASIILAGYLIVYGANKPEELWTKTQVRYGPQTFDIRDPFSTKTPSDLCNLPEDNPTRPKACSINFIRRNLDVEIILGKCESLTDKPVLCDKILQGGISEADLNRFLVSCAKSNAEPLCNGVKNITFEQVYSYLSNISNWPRPNLENGFKESLTRFSPFIAEHKKDAFLRIDVSPKLGGVVQTLNFESDISQINLYAVTLSLLNPYWGYEQQVFFSKNTGNTINVNNLAKWFGIKYLFLENQLDPIDKYRADPVNWQEVDTAGIWKFANPTELHSWTVHKPAFLVIGSKSKAAFDPIFRVAVNGGYNYDDGYLIQGKENVDDYSLAELKKFSGLILFGYSYKSQSEAFKLLDSYVKDGGNLFIETGWQYVDRDWQIAKAPAFLPVNDLVWSSQNSGNVQIADSEIVSGVDLTKFSPLKWNDLAWGVSQPGSGLKSWAKTIVSLDGKPLIAGGNYGKGKVVWSGINLPGHINTYDNNPEELKLFRSIMTWLDQSAPNEELTQSAKVNVQRNHPDKVKFTFTEATNSSSVLYWRESFYSRWVATLDNGGKKQKVAIYKAGPGFMFFDLPKLDRGATLTLEFVPGILSTIQGIVSILFLIALTLFVLGIIKFKTSSHIEKIKSHLKSWRQKSSLKEEEEY